MFETRIAISESGAGIMPSTRWNICGITTNGTKMPVVFGALRAIVANGATISVDNPWMKTNITGSNNCLPDEVDLELWLIIENEYSKQVPYTDLILSSSRNNDTLAKEPEQPSKGDVGIKFRLNYLIF